MNSIKNLFLYGILLFGFLPIIPNKFKGLPVILITVIALILYFVKKVYTFNFKKVIIYASLYILYLLSLFLTTNFLDIDKILTTRVSIIIFPLLFGLVNSSISSISQKQLRLFISTYFIVSIIYCGLIVLFYYQQGFLTKNVGLNLYYSYLTYEMWGINQHPIYASMFIAIAMLFGMKLMFDIEKVIYRLGIILGLITLFSMLLFLSRKGVLIALILASFVYLVYQIKNRKQKTYLIIGIIGIGITILVAPITQKRFKEVFRLSSYDEIDKTNSTSIRYGVYYCAINKIIEKPIFGHGIGDVKSELDACYSKTSKILLQENYNSHNQYLSIWLSCGIIGLLVFIGFIFYNFKIALKQNNIFFLSLVLFFCILMLFENILERQSGVILFSLIINFFAFITVQNHKNSFNFD